MAKNIAVITGASSGLGREFVRLITHEREIDEIWSIARNQSKLDALSEEYGKKIKTISLDLSKREAHTALKTMLIKEEINIKYLINNAGFAKFCSYDDISVEESLNMIDLNIGAVVAIGLICIPYMKSGSHIINISSQASFFPLPYQNIYSSTKAFIRNYTRALNVELNDKGIIATAVCPGWIKTGLFERGIIGAKKGTNKFTGMVTPDAVAEKALKDAKNNKDISVYSAFVKTTHVLSKLVPQRLVMKIWLAIQGIK